MRITLSTARFRPLPAVRATNYGEALRRSAPLHRRGAEANGADDRDRTGDLVLTKDALYRLSYIGRIHAPNPENLERETGIEPATNSLEGCDSTTELLPPS